MDLPRLAFRPWVALVILAVCLPWPVPDAHAGPSKAKALVDAYLKARKDADRKKAWAAVLEAPPLAEKEIPGLAKRALALLAKRGRKLGSGRRAWFDEKKDPYEGLYVVQGKGRKGLVLALHGGGLGSADLGGAVSGFGGTISSLKMTGVFPQALQATEYGWTDPPETEKWVLELLKAARRTWKIDPDRVYVTGHSMGGYGAWTYGGIHADLFGGAAAFAGAPTVYWKRGRKDVEAEGVVDGLLPNLRNLPLFCYQSLDDPRVRPAANQQAAADLAKLREADGEGWNFRYEEVDGRGHGFPKKGPKPGLLWITSFARDPRPTTVHWQPVRAWKTTFYWLRWTDPWLTSVLVAKVDRGANRIDVTLEAPRSTNPKATEAEREGRVAALSFYVDERLLDLSRDVVVVVDGKERYRGVPEPRLETLLRSAGEREDREYVFAREVILR